MTTIQLAQRLLRRLKVRDLALLPADDAQELLDAINAGVQKFYAVCPGIYRQTTFSGVLRPGVPIGTIGVTQGSNLFTGYNASTDQKGYTIRIGDDDRDNMIVAENGLLDDYEGTAGQQSATVWGDCIGMDPIISRMTSDPKLDTGQTLIKDDMFQQWGGYWPTYGFMAGWFTGIWMKKRQVGLPRRYWIEAVGQVQGAAQPFVLRVDTLPDRLYRLRFNGEIYPPKFLMDSLLVAANVPVNESVVERLLLPIIEGELTESALWRDDKAIPRIQKKAEQALLDVQTLPNEFGNSNNQVSTPVGY